MLPDQLLSFEELELRGSRVVELLHGVSIVILHVLLLLVFIPFMVEEVGEPSHDQP